MVLVLLLLVLIDFQVGNNANNKVKYTIKKDILEV